MLAKGLMLMLLNAAPVAPTVHVHAAGDSAFRANAYLVETKDGVVAVDAPFTNSEAKAFRAELDALGKPLLAVLVTHAHPDHVNGITALVGDRKVPILATAGVRKTLEAIDAPKRAYWSPIYKEEYPAVTTFPNQTVKNGGSVTFGGVKFTAHDVGRGESESETLWVMDGKAAFVGDLVMNQTHPWLAEGHSTEWLASLQAAKKPLAKVTTVYPGHGAQGGVDMLDWQARYLEAYRAEVKALAKGASTLDEEQKKQLAAKMEGFLPNAPLAMLVGMSADSVAAELAPAKK